MKINGIEELKLLKNEMIKDFIQIVFQIKEKLTNSEIEGVCDKFEKFENIVRININFCDNPNCNVYFLEKFLDSLASLPKLQSLKIELSGNKLADLTLCLVSKKLLNLVFLKELSLNFSVNNIGDSGFQDLSNALSILRNLDNLELDFSGNCIKSKKKIIFCYYN